LRDVSVPGDRDLLAERKCHLMRAAVVAELPGQTSVDTVKNAFRAPEKRTAFDSNPRAT
jgi:hypothetical protein